MTAPDLASLPSFTGTWNAESATEDLARWTAFVVDQNITWSPTPADRDVVAQLSKNGTRAGGEVIEMRLSKGANDALTAAGDPRRVLKLAGQPRWYVLSPEQRAALATDGHRFESPSPMRQLATIPITLGVYFAALYGLRELGVSQNLAWGIALVAWVITTRVVRGRWPFQRG